MQKDSYPLSILLLVSALFLTAFGAFGRQKAYAGYDYRYEEAPLLTLPLRAFADGVLPFDDAPVVAEDAVLTVTAPEDDVPPPPVAVVEEAHAPEEEISAEETPAQELPPEEETANPAEENAPGVPFSSPDASLDSYYADALFIGDSRTVGLSQYCPGLDEYATFYCQVSLTIFSTLQAPCAQTAQGVMSVEQALMTERFGKIYLMVGINEAGYDPDGFIAAYAQVVARIRELQPDAVIYIQSIMHVSAKKEQEQPVFSNAAIDERNRMLRTLCNEVDICYIDLNYKTDDETSALSQAYTFDGVHLTADAYALWYEAIRAQTR